MSEVLQRKGIVVSNKQLTSRLYLLEVKVEDIPALVAPGQFVHMKLPSMDDHILRRPFSIFYVDKAQSRLVILYQVVGFGTQRMTLLATSDTVDIMGPIGHGWTIPCDIQEKKALLVAGGVGGAPLYMHAKELLQQGFNVSVVLGAQTKEALVVLEKYLALLGEENILIATDDGSFGYKGFCTDLVLDELENNKPSYLACCGPEPMMKIVSNMSLAHEVQTAISLEKRMACGIGACLSCVVSTTSGNKRSCVDGPVFDAAEVIWE